MDHEHHCSHEEEGVYQVQRHNHNPTDRSIGVYPAGEDEQCPDQDFTDEEDADPAERPA